MWKNPDIKPIPSAHFFSVNLGDLTLKKKKKRQAYYIKLSHLAHTMSHRLRKRHSLEKMLLKWLGAERLQEKLKISQTHTCI